MVPAEDLYAKLLVAASKGNLKEFEAVFSKIPRESINSGELLKAVQECLNSGPETFPILERLLQENSVNEALNRNFENNQALLAAVKKAAIAGQFAKVYRIIIAIRRSAELFYPDSLRLELKQAVEQREVEAPKVKRLELDPKICVIAGNIGYPLLHILLDPAVVLVFQAAGFAHIQSFVQNYLPRLKASFGLLEEKKHQGLEEIGAAEDKEAAENNADAERKEVAENKADAEIIYTYHHLKPYYLTVAATQGNLELVQQLLEEGYVNNALNAGEIRALTLQAAARNDHLEVLDYLLSIEIFRKDVELNNNEILICAVAHGHLGIVKRILKEGIHHILYPGFFVIAAVFGRLEIIQCFLECEAIRNGLSHPDNCVLPAAIYFNHLAIVKLLIQQPALQIAANLTNHWKKFYKKEGDENAKNFLLKAVQLNNLLMLDSLLEVEAISSHLTLDNDRVLFCALDNGFLPLAFRLAVEYKKKDLALPAKLFTKTYHELFQRFKFRSISDFFQTFIKKLKGELAILQTVEEDFNIRFPKDVSGIIVDYWQGNINLKKVAEILLPYEYYGELIILDNINQHYDNPWDMVAAKVSLWGKEFPSDTEIEDDPFFRPTDNDVLNSYTPILEEYYLYLCTEIPKVLENIPGTSHLRHSDKSDVKAVEPNLQEVLVQAIKNDLVRELSSCTHSGDAFNGIFPLVSVYKIVGDSKELREACGNVMNRFALMDRCYTATQQTLQAKKQRLLDFIAGKNNAGTANNAGTTSMGSTSLVFTSSAAALTSSALASSLSSASSSASASAAASSSASGSRHLHLQQHSQLHCS